MKVRTDCDGDTLLLTVRPRGPACHTGKYSCFGDKAFSLAELSDVIRERLGGRQAGSYTSSLTGGAHQGEDPRGSRGTGIGPNKDEIVWEAADVLYFVCVLLAKNDILLAEVMSELRRRRRGPRRSDGGSEAGS